jgi:4-amino-4-deoxy-L-arabinose transferase-like glycosyltransferase
MIRVAEIQPRAAMSDIPRLRLPDLLLMLIVLAVAGGGRAWYLIRCTDSGKTAGPVEVQGPSPRLDHDDGVEFRGRKNPAELDALIDNLAKDKWFGSLAPLANEEERTAHRAPGYAWVAALAVRWLGDADADRAVRWGQCLLGALTAACYFFFARRAFRSTLVGFLAGLLCAIHPFWVVNTAEINDGVLATFLLAFGIALGTRASQEGGPFTSLIFGLSMAALSMVRATLLPFATVAMLWFLLHCRKLSKGWFPALLAFLGFANGLAPWAVRNFQAFGELVPVADSAGWHLWMGNNPDATGGPLDEKTLRAALGAERIGELTTETSQTRRYARLSADVLNEVSSDPGHTLARRLWSMLFFVFGEDWFTDNRLSLQSAGAMPAWLDEIFPGLLFAALLAMLLLGTLGWRWTFVWRRQARLATLAAIWVPLPYLLSHAEMLSGPRLPLDGVLICYSAFVLGYLIPGVGRALRRGPERERTQKETARTVPGLY